ncbi:MAG: NAD-dependent epimerase/dehydratase family protein [Victivallales bacterium]
MKALITGVAGMLGSHLLDELMNNPVYETVFGIDDLSVGVTGNIAQWDGNPRFKFINGSILDESLISGIPRVDIVIHLAASKKIGEINPGVENLYVNGIGAANIFKMALKHKAKVLFASTSDCYGMSKDLPFKEDGDLVLGPSMIKRWSYAVGKLYSEQLAFAFHKDYGLPVVIIRYFGGFSERASFSWSGGHIPIFIDAILKDMPCIIHGDGLQTRSMTYVSNLVDGTLLAMENDNAIGELINIGDDREISVLDSAKIIHGLSGSKNPLDLKFISTEKIFGSYKDIMRRRPDLSKATSLLGYKIKTSFEEGIMKVVKERKKCGGKVK